MISFNTIARKAAEDLGLPGPEAAAAPAEDQKSEKKASKEEAEEVNISLSVKSKTEVSHGQKIYIIYSTNVVSIIDSIIINSIRWRMIQTL